jgi:CRISPR-associated exonuclease Cas4
VTDLRAILVSALRHYVYCPRQCALVHLEQQWGENLFTLRGQHSHRRVDEGAGEWDAGVRVERSMPIWSERLGLTGKADVVEFHPDGTVYPVEYKHGPRGPGLHFDVQLCAQALCLEEMLGVAIPLGAIYHVKSRRRREVVLDVVLRERTEEAVQAVRELLSQRSLPPPVEDRALCRACSLIELCMPDLAPVATPWLFDPAVDEPR